MKGIKKYLTLTLLALGVIFTQAPSAFAQGAYTVGQVRKVDLDQGKITIRHEEIKNLDMPPMTMVFNVKNKSQLKELKAGENVEFVAASEGGKLFVTDIKKGNQND